MSGAAKGLLLAMLNVVVVALGFATTITSNERFEIAIFSVYIGLVPALITGLVVGRIAEALPRFRLPVIVAIPIAVVLFLGLVAQAIDGGGEGPAISSAVIGFACIPTVVAAIVLERWTRPAKPQPVPPAIVA